MSIHPTAIISAEAHIGTNVAVGPYAIIEEDTVIGDNCVISASAQIRRGTRMGDHNLIGSGALIGADPQFRGWDKSLKTGTTLGSHNEIREYSTIHRSIHEGQNTTVGCHNYLMTGTHFGHDCVVGNHNTFANNCLLGGHVIFGNHSFVGGGSAIHQFVRVGDYCMMQGLSGVSLDVPPYVIVHGVNLVAGINAVGLKRADFPIQARKEIKDAFLKVYRGIQTLEEILQQAQELEIGPEARAFYDFLSQKSKKGYCIRAQR